ncbi:hypothetical protein [Alkalibaculum bacchi]|nr:hypothetical protein [Alkalibaculum bacchi]
MKIQRSLKQDQISAFVSSFICLDLFLAITECFGFWETDLTVTYKQESL